MSRFLKWLTGVRDDVSDSWKEAKRDTEVDRIRQRVKNEKVEEEAAAFNRKVAAAEEQMRVLREHINELKKSILVSEAEGDKAAVSDGVYRLEIELAWLRKLEEDQRWRIQTKSG